MAWLFSLGCVLSPDEGFVGPLCSALRSHTHSHLVQPQHQHQLGRSPPAGDVTGGAEMFKYTINLLESGVFSTSKNKQTSKISMAQVILDSPG